MSERGETVYYSPIPHSPPPPEPRYQPPHNMSERGETVYYSPIPHSPPPPEPRYQPPPPPQQNYIVLPLCFPPSRLRVLRRRLIGFGALLLVAAVIYVIWPSDPDLKIVRVGLSHFHVRTSPTVCFDISMALTIKVRNKDLFFLNYSSIVVSIGYRGKQLGFVTSDGGLVRARGSSYVNATLLLDGIEVFHDMLPLLEDLARGSIAFDTITEVQGQLGFLFFFDIPLKGKISCEMHVNTVKKTIMRQDCYPE
ncbi:PREDICTED: uncharacterized protein LOC104592233 isoform X1 [Nelumbo nucifera]|uniref:Uncharacterized protein LOC104592233 isoform X1 n=2 Tax=Nelumbo nucifera TaxID=4432 RepID=A0A1U7ZEI0_NELNU|nr:PREDICTED: uncharacterized protein LOC104592233 isoform X1 [Nelumbo nucifera]